jgi:hypothetical protein
LAYLLIILVIAVALAPLSHFVPSKRQREVARMREFAAVNGLFVEFRGVPGRDKVRSSDRDSAGRDTIYYGKRIKPAKAKARKAQAWRFQNGRWMGLERRAEVPAELASMPAEVLAASVDEGSCGVYWQEAGGVEKVAVIRQALEVWAGEMRD